MTQLQHKRKAQQATGKRKESKRQRQAIITFDDIFHSEVNGEVITANECTANSSITNDNSVIEDELRTYIQTLGDEQLVVDHHENINGSSRPLTSMALGASSSLPGNNNNLLEYLESMRQKYPNPPAWILSTLEKHLNIDINVLQSWWFLNQLEPINECLSVPATTATPASTLSLETIAQLVSKNMSLDINALMLHNYNQSLPYLSLSLFKHDVQLPNESILNLDELTRSSDNLLNCTADPLVSAQIIDALYTHICELEAFIIFFSANKYTLEQQVNSLLTCPPTPGTVFDEEVLIDGMFDQRWKTLQKQTQMVSSSDIYGSLDTSSPSESNCGSTDPSELDVLVAYISQELRD